jgi:hypothetical protein
MGTIGRRTANKSTNLIDLSKDALLLLLLLYILTVTRAGNLVACLIDPTKVSLQMTH